MDDPLVTRLQSAECQPLLDRLRKQLLQGEPLSGKCRLSGLNEQQRRRIVELTGSSSRGKTITVDLEVFQQVVHNTGRFDSLRQLVETAVGGPIENRRANRASYDAAWTSVWESAHRLVGETNVPFISADGLTECLQDLRGGWLVRATRRDSRLALDLIQRALKILQQLPLEPTPLSIFAAEQTGDAHSLDQNQTLGRLVIKLLAAGSCSSKNADLRRAGSRRILWESVGVVTDELSSSALVLNLPATGESLTDKMLRQHAADGMPCRVTFRHLRLFRPTFSSNQTRQPLYVCENPSVLAAAADRFGSRCPPMVCVEGQPGLTCWSILQMLHRSGFQLNYHGDFDWGGLRIANKLYEAFAFRPWRFSASDHSTVSSNHRPLKPPAAEALWDADLADAIRSSGVAVEEESLIELLLSDLDGTLRGGLDILRSG